MLNGAAFFLMSVKNTQIFFQTVNKVILDAAEGATRMAHVTVDVIKCSRRMARDGFIDDQAWNKCFDR
jgi:hypothetical protein